jgi:shikimate kinase
LSRRIFLVGPRGSGKSTVAAVLANLLGWQWVDADTLLEQRAGRTIRTLFAEEGEASFRQREADLLEELCQQEELVIATGGGVVLRDDNRERLRRGFVVWLCAEVETLWQRIAGDPTTAERRPNLGSGGREEVAQVVASREPLYREVAMLTLDSGQLSPKELAQQIAEAWRTHFGL